MSSDWLNCNRIDSHCQAAQAYRDQGLAVVPVAGKRPVVSWQTFQERLPTKQEVEDMFSSGNVTGVGIVTGSASMLAVIDVDDPVVFAAGERELPQTPTVITARGQHYWCRLSEPLTIQHCPENGFDLLAQGGLVIAPYSQHPSGAVYQWQPGASLDDLELAELPGWAYDLGRQPVDQGLELTGSEAALTGAFWEQPEKIVRCVRPCIERLKDSFVPVGSRNRSAFIIASDWKRRLAGQYQGQALYRAVWARVADFYLLAATPGEAWTEEIRDTVLSAINSPAKPLRCRQPQLQRFCVGKAKCPYVQALQQTREAVPQLDPPPELSDSERRLWEAVGKLEHKYGRRPGEWIVTSQAELGHLLGVSQPRANLLLQKATAQDSANCSQGTNDANCNMYNGGVIAATGQAFEELIEVGEVSVASASGTAIKRGMAESVTQLWHGKSANIAATGTTPGADE